MKDIETLKKLQEIDSEIYKLKSEMDENPHKLAEMEQKFSGESDALKALEDSLKKIQIAHKEKELDLQTKEQNIAKQSTQLFQVKSNKEYNALQLEIEKQKADNSILEEDVIMGLEKIDSLKQSIAVERESFVQKEQEFKKQKSVIESKSLELKQQIESFQVKRKVVLEAGIDPKVLELYERILEHNGESAVALVKNDACQGCFRTVRAQVVNELQMGKLITCENCTRILYVAPEGQ
ncbi:MAG: C4-type zinc ribbon domain-containing protein [Candidatus Omnitrophota bacterium]